MNMVGPDPISILLLCDFDPFNAQMVQDSIHAIVHRSHHDVHCLSFRGELPENLDLSRFDAIAIHYSTFIHDNRYLGPDARRRIALFTGAKAVFLHDEYKHVNRTKAALAEISARALFTCFSSREAEQVYGDLFGNGLRTYSVLPGYVSPELTNLDPGPSTSSRRIDIGYRGREYPAWHGELGQDRVRIHQRISAQAAACGITVDSSVAERDRLYGSRWLEFQRKCKMVLGTESGASVIDFTGEIARNVEAHVAAAPETPFEELKRLYFAEHEERHPLRTISPRIFEALACGCGLILYEGSYAGRLTPDTHYFALRRDNMNFADLVKILCEPKRIEAMVKTAREDVLHAPENQERHLIDLFDSVMSRLSGPRRARGYEKADFLRQFGPYDTLFNRYVLTRQCFRIADSAYTAATSSLPHRLQRQMRNTIHGLLARLKRQ